MSWPFLFLSFIHRWLLCPSLLLFLFPVWSDNKRRGCLGDCVALRLGDCAEDKKKDWAEDVWVHLCTSTKQKREFIRHLRRAREASESLHHGQRGERYAVVELKFNGYLQLYKTFFFMKCWISSTKYNVFQLFSECAGRFSAMVSFL